MLLSSIVCCLCQTLSQERGHREVISLAPIMDPRASAEHGEFYSCFEEMKMSATFFGLCSLLRLFDLAARSSRSVVLSSERSQWLFDLLKKSNIALQRSEARLHHRR